MSDALPDPARVLAIADQRDQETQAKEPTLRLVDLQARWATLPDPPQFVVEHIVPLGALTLMSGHGSSGKSNVVAVMLAHAAAGHPFAGLAVQRSRVVFVSLEDPPEVVHIRLSRIIKAYDLPEKQVLENFTLIDGSRGDATLVKEYSGGVIETPVFSELREAVAGHRLIAVDNASDAYGANENSRPEVRSFLKKLTGLARDNDAGLILLAHVDKQSAKVGGQGNSYSGSTAWHNSARSRLALSREDDELKLVHEKCNLGPLGPELRFTIGTGGVPVPALDLSDRPEDFTDMLPAFRAAARAKQNVYNNLQPGSHCAQGVLENFDELPSRYRGKAGRKLAGKGIAKLLADGLLLVDTYTRSGRKQAERLVAAPVVTGDAAR